MNIYLDLFLTFAKVGVCTFGGGYAMLPILQREVVEDKGWATSDELADYFAIGQCTPGIIAVNTATFVGQKLCGNFGGICATLGVVAPSVVIITAIAAFLENFAHLAVVNHAFGGIRACVVALILSSVLKLAKKPLQNTMGKLIFSIVLLLSLLGSYWSGLPASLSWLTSPVTLVVLAGLWGFVYGMAQKEGN